MHSGHGFAYDTMRRAEVYSRHPLEAGQDSLALQHSLATSANLEHQVCPQGPKNIELIVSWDFEVSQVRKKKVDLRHFPTHFQLEGLSVYYSFGFSLWVEGGQRWSSLGTWNSITFLAFFQTNADGDTASSTTTPAVGFPHSEVHFPIKKEFGKNNICF